MIHITRITYLDNFGRGCTKQVWPAPKKTLPI